jgi:hypothetical protein
MVKHWFLILVLSLTATAGVALGQEGYGGWPVTATIEPDKTEVLAGEQIGLTIHNLVDDVGAPADDERYIAVRADHGRIMNGEQHLGTGWRLFLIGSGRVRVQYAAPASSEKDTIRVNYTLMAKKIRPEDPDELIPRDEIGNATIDVITHDIAQLGYYKYYHNEQDPDDPFTLEYDVNIAIHFEMIEVEVDGQKVGGFGTGIPYTVKSAAVMGFSGSAKSNDADYKLVSVTPVDYKSAVTFYADMSTGEIEAVHLPRISATLGWEGESGYVPPDRITLEPVNEWDNEEAEEDLEEQAEKLEAQMKGNKDGNFFETLMDVQKSIQDVVVHPEYRVTATFDKNYVSGGGEFSDSGDGWNLIERFKWDAQRTK